ncbi:MAG: hypothetical protein M0R80_24650 [Proteobacteria bacterium]|jgi:hypothetical protein|nr:hypothetical protein [Pseudomonadota bacterium]
MSRKQVIVIVAAAVAALLAPGLASAQEEAADAGAPGEEAAPDADAPEPLPAEPVLDEPFVPEEPIIVPYDDGAQPPPASADLDDGKPFAKGDMEPGFGLGFLGYGDLFYMSIGGSFAYYVVNRLAPGLEVSYGTDFGSADIPDSVTLLPFLKFVILRNPRFAPYLIAFGGREFQFNGYNAAHSWIVGGGAGVHIGIGEHVAIKIQLTFQHHWYDDAVISGYDDDALYKDGDGNKYPPPSGFDREDVGGWDPAVATDGTPCLVNPSDDTIYTCATKDKSDLTHDWIFPIISVGMTFSF